MKTAPHSGTASQEAEVRRVARLPNQVFLPGGFSGVSITHLLLRAEVLC